MELEAVLPLSRTDLEDKGLIHISEKGDGNIAFEIVSSLANSSESRSATDWVDTGSSLLDTHDKKVVFPHFSSPRSRIVTLCSSILPVL